MKRLTGAVDKNGNFVVGKTPKTPRHSGYKEENNDMQRLTHAAELVQPFHPDGTRNTAYSTIYHEQAIKQGIVEEDPLPDFQRFE
jgi:hypothetical protein